MDLQSTPFVAALNRYPDLTVGAASNEPPIPWTYMPADAPPLAELRERCGLAAVVDGKPEVDAILALLDWAYRAVEHDGGAENPEPRNALNILRHCRETGAPVNCRMKSILLSEAYLATGFRSRYITCMPAVADGDCHVVVLVFATSLGRWLTVDPTHNTCFLGADGTILNVVEARRAYRLGTAPAIRHIDRVQEAPLYCAGVECRSYDEFYRLYMAKNCFRFECPLAGESGIDSRVGAPVVRLEPRGYGGGGCGDSGGRPVTVTHCASRFLAAP